MLSLLSITDDDGERINISLFPRVALLRRSSVSWPCWSSPRRRYQCGGRETVRVSELHHQVPGPARAVPGLLPPSLWSSAQLQTWLTHSRSALLWSNFSPGSVPLRSFPSLRRKTGSPDFQARLAMNVWIYPQTQLSSAPTSDWLGSVFGWSRSAAYHCNTNTGWLARLDWRMERDDELLVEIFL